MIDSREKNFVSAVVYIHDASEQVEHFVSTLMKQLSDHFEHSEIICVNDASTDDSHDRIKKAVEAVSTGLTSVTILNLSFFHGLESAMNAGKDLAIGDFVFEFDSTILDFEPSEILNVYKKSLEGYDIVSAVPQMSTDLSTKIFYSMLNKFGDFSYKHCTERFRIISRRAINRISSLNRQIVYRKADYASCGMKSTMIQYTPANVSKLPANTREVHYRHELAVSSLLVFTKVGYRISIAITFLMGFISLGMLVYSLVVYLMQEPVRGWTSAMLFISFGFCGLFIILTIIIRYLQLLVGLSFKRGSFTFESIEKITK